MQSRLPKSPTAAFRTTEPHGTGGFAAEAGSCSEEMAYANTAEQISTRGPDAAAEPGGEESEEVLRTDGGGKVGGVVKWGGWSILRVLFFRGGYFEYRYQIQGQALGAMHWV